MLLRQQVLQCQHSHRHLLAVGSLHAGPPCGPDLRGRARRLDLGHGEQRFVIRLPFRRAAHSFRAHVTPYSAIRNPCPVILAKSANLFTGSEIFSEKNFHDCYDPTRCVRTQRYKYIRSFEPERVPRFTMPADIRRSIASNTLRPDAGDPRPAEELYDLHADPDENVNLAADPAHKAVRDELADKLETWMRDTGDFLPGPMPTPPPTQPLESFVKPPEPE